MVNRVSRQSVSNRSTRHRTFHGTHSMVNRVSRHSVIQPVKQPLCQIQNFARCSQYGEPCQPTVNQSVSNHSTRYRNFHCAHSMVNRVSRQSVNQPVINHSARYRTLHGAHSMVNRVSRQSVNQPVKQPLCQIQNFTRCSQYGEPCQPSVSNSASQTTTLAVTELCTVLTVW